MTPDQTGKNYNKIAKWWTATQMKRPEYGMAYIQKAMDHAKRNAVFLDVGCGGTGRVIDEALNSDFQVTGIDVSSEMIRLAKDRHPDINFINDDFIAWETCDHFDLIIAWDSLFHTPVSLQGAATRKMCDLLNPGGVLLFTGGAYAGEASGNMEGVLFEYGTIGYRETLELFDDMDCKIILMEEDQFPAGHMVFICQKS